MLTETPEVEQKMNSAKERMSKYKALAVAFSYPDEQFSAYFPQVASEQETLQLDYDKLFRASGVWLYGCEYTSENEFQRAQGLADINGFYRAFAVEPDKDRPDALNMELEFMHYLILKEMRAQDAQKAFICFDAQKKFFREHLYPAAKKIAEKISNMQAHNFYLEAARDLLGLLESEKELFK